MNQNDASPAVKLEGVTKAFNERKVLDNITLEVAQGTEGVGRTATRSVVLSSIMIIVTNVVLVRLIFFLFPSNA